MTGPTPPRMALSWVWALVLVGWAAWGFAQPSTADTPVIDAPVVDTLPVTSAAEQATIGRMLEEHRRRTGVQMAVLYVRSTQGEPIDDYALRVATAWGGGEKGRDDGVLLVFAVSDRRMRLEVGYGIEPAIPDAVARRMLDDAKPQLRAGEYASAARIVVEQVIERTRHLEPGTRATPYNAPFGSYSVFAYLLAMLLGVIAGVMFPRQRKEEGQEDGDSTRSRWGLHVRRWLWLAALFAVGGLTWTGGYGWAYMLVCAVGSVVGFATNAWREKYPGTTVLFYFCLGGTFMVGAATQGKLALPPLVVAKLAGLHVMVAIGATLALRLLGLIMGASGSGGSSSTYSSSSWSSSSSSWSSSSSSSSWSSSGSSSSWSGGGGSFGGGGASSSW